MLPIETPGTALRRRMADGLLVLPGVYSAISAKAAAAAGAEALYLSGAGVTNSLLAMPDIALLTLTEMSQQAAFVTQAAQGIPVIADADTGYGDVHNVFRTISELERTGLAGVHLEDQVSPKRCGHLDGKGLVPVEQMKAKLLAAAEARRDPSFLLIARTDARAVEGLEPAIDRARHYADCGVDAVFPEGLQSEREFEAFRKALDLPLLANMTEFGKTPIITSDRFAELGYNLVIFPMTAFRVMLKAISDAYGELIAFGTQTGLLERMKTRDELYELIEYGRYNEVDARWAEQARRGNR